MGLLHKTQTAIKETKKIFVNSRKRKNIYSSKRKIYIPGIEKCGSTSLEKYLINKEFDIVREESIYCRSFALYKYKLQYPDYQTLFIIRDPIERIWSHYNYKRYYHYGDRREIKCSFKEALIKHPEMVEASNYAKWFLKWRSTNPIIIKLEDLQKQSDFPMTNTTKKLSLNESQRNLIIDACNSSGFDPTTYNQFKITPIETFLNSS